MATIFVLIIVFIFGGEVIRGFIFALLFGIVFGTYSSLFISTPVLYETTRKKGVDDNVQPAETEKKKIAG
jgi:SecD/SecF fusion protein